jgi:hypothetical protein
MARRLFAGILFGGLIGAQLLATPAPAQFGSIFGGPPRPPANIPQPPQDMAPPPDIAQPPGMQQPLPPPAPLSSSAPRQGAQDSIQSQPLPPPPGSSAAPAARLSAPPPPSSPSGQPSVLQPGGAPAASANTASAPGDVVVVPPPEHKIANPTAVFSGLDKITGRITSFDVAIGETVQFGALQVTPRACYSRPPTEAPRTDAFVEVDEVTLKGEIRRIFSGWMFAASPGLHAVEHPIYDVWLTDCKGGVVADTGQPEPSDTRANSSQR